MAIIQKNNPVGIDKVIDRIQKYIDDNISWDSNEYNNYPRVYLNPTIKRGKKIPELYDGNGEYRELMYNDNFAAESYFIVDENKTIAPPDGLIKTNISLIFQLDVDFLYPTVDHRADEEAHKEVMNILNKIPNVKKTGIVTGIENVYRNIDIEQNKLDDMQPCHVFKIDMEVNYQYGC